MAEAVSKKRKIEAKLKKNLSKNRKKGWRKNVEIEDVEEFIEEERLQLRTGGLVSEKPDDELFVIERKPAVESFIPLKKEGGKKKLKEKLKCYRSLENHSKIEVPIKPNKTRAAAEKYNEHAKETLLRKQEISKKKKLKTSCRQKIEPKNNVYDLWADDAIQEDVDEEIVKHYKRTTNTEPVKIPCYMFQKPSLLAAVEVPHAGTSYNPAYDDHQELLMKANDVEIKKLREQQRLKRALDDKFPTKEDAPKQETWLAEMSQGLHDDSEDSDSGINEESEINFLHKNPPVRGDQRKLRSKRRREKLLKIQKKTSAETKEKTVQENEIFRLKQMKKEITEKEKIIAEKSMKSSKRKADKLYKPARIGKYRYQDPDMEVVLTEELTGSLRQLKPEGHLLEDRFKSFQKRNVLQPSIRQKVKRKYKLKKYVKRGHKVV